MEGQDGERCSEFSCISAKWKSAARLSLCRLPNNTSNLHHSRRLAPFPALVGCFEGGAKKTVAAELEREGIVS